MPVLKKNPGFLPLLAAALLAACALFIFCLPVSNPDVFWHLSAGRWMAEHRSIPKADWLSWTLSGQTWADFEWLTQAVFYAAYKLAGFWGLWALKLLQLAACGALILRILSLYEVSLLGRAFGVFAWALGVYAVNDLRPENFSLLFFLALWDGLERHRLGRTALGPAALSGRGEHLPSEGGASQSAAVKCALLAVLFALWSNLHAGFAYGLVLLAIYAVKDWLKERRLEPALWLLAAACGSLLNPFGPSIYALLWKHWLELGGLKKYIVEWMEASVLEGGQWPFWVLLVSSFALALWRLRHLPAEHLAALALFGLAASRHARLHAYFVSVAVPVAASALLPYARARAARGLLAAGAVAGLIFFSGRIAPSLLRGWGPFDSRHVPAQLAAFLDAERPVLAPKRMLNVWHWGGFLGFALAPDYKVFFDGRYIFHSLLDRYHKAQVSPTDFQKFLESGSIGVALLERTSLMLPVRAGKKSKSEKTFWRPYYAFFMPEKLWALVYWDRQAMAFVRRGSFPKEWVEPKEFKYFRPDDLNLAERLLEQKSVRREEIAAEVEKYLALYGNQRDAAEAQAWLSGLK
ncbi:MAG: hypothetical protein HY922_14925 [Elusimicrobia bacterium]|nr:hypothetical protein [Elusimicrobiota bacterium]